MRAFTFYALLALSTAALVSGQVLTVTAVERTSYDCQVPLPLNPICLDNPYASCEGQLNNVTNGACVLSPTCCVQPTGTCYTHHTKCGTSPNCNYGPDCVDLLCWNPTVTVTPYLCPLGPCSQYAYQAVELVPCANFTAYLLDSEGAITTQSQDCQESMVCASNFLSVYRVNQTVGEPAKPCPKSSGWSDRSPSFMVTLGVLVGMVWVRDM